MHVDHIKPRSLFPLLAADPENLQVLCEDCNVGKSNVDTTDWRPVAEPVIDEIDAEHMRSITAEK
jgi:5-methylcytosine-specific restriction endonuclease McrA